MKIALCGNPNVGKTTLFNRLTHSDAPVGNWHGVTVDSAAKRMGKDALLVDLPGAYSLVPRTNEERITVDNILGGGYDVIVYVAEANNLRRNLYMLVQILETDKPTVLAVNMMDEARGAIDLSLLSERLGIPVVGTSVKDNNPKQLLLDAAEKAISTRVKKPMPRVGSVCDGRCAECDADSSARRIYAYIDRLLDGVWARPAISKRTKKIDRAILGKAALPIFLAVMAAVFLITFEAGRPLSDMLVSLIEKACLPVRESGMPDWAISLLCDGVISGVGGVLAFLPQVVILFLLTAILQDSGYMSRAAFVTDDFFKKFGLSGRAAFSLVLGLGCSATAVLSSRGIAGEDIRKRTAFATPFCPCSARLAVFTAISAYFGFSGFVVAAMYVLGFLSALVVLKIMCAFGKKTDCDSALIMEMPPYRLPQIKRVLGVVWRNVLSFAARVGSVVLGVSVIMWILCNFSMRTGFVGGVENSIMQTFASFIAPVFKPLGFGNWRAVAALLSGVAAKETVISVIASLGGMSAVFDTRASALSFMVFTCLYVPCVATLSALAKENGAKSAAMSVLVHTLAAYVASAAMYGSAIGFAYNRTLCISIWAGIVSATVAATIARALFVKHKRRESKAKA